MIYPNLTLSYNTAMLLLRCSIITTGILTILLLLYHQALKTPITKERRGAVIKISTPAKTLYEATTTYLNYVKNTGISNKSENLKNAHEKSRKNFNKTHNDCFIFFDDRINKLVDIFKRESTLSCIFINSFDYKAQKVAIENFEDVYQSLVITFKEIVQG
jgi:hypothetical protein